MITWNHILHKLYQLKSKHLQRKEHSIASYLSQNNSIGFLTFRISVDGVASTLSDHVNALRRLKENGMIEFSKVVLMCAELDMRFWNSHDLCDSLHLIPQIGLNCAISSNFYSHVNSTSSRLNQLAQNIWEKAHFIARKMKRIIKEEGIGLLIVENVNSLPYNICASLGIVLAAEELKLPVINVCHDFYWEHKHGTRCRLFANSGNPDMFGLLKILCPWSSPYWIHATTTQTARTWLINRGWEESDVEVLPHAVIENIRVPKTILDSKPAIVDLINRLPITALHEMNLTYSEPVRVVHPNFIHLTRNKIPYVILIPTKISSGKRIDSALCFLNNILEDREFQTYLENTGRFLCVIVSGPIYDVPENNDYINVMYEQLLKIYMNTSIPITVLNELMFLFPMGISPINSTADSLSMDALYQESDVALFFSSRETFGLPIIESAAFGTPLIITPYDGIHREIYNEVTEGLLLSEVQRSEIINKPLPQSVQCLLLDDTLREVTRKNNSETVHRRFSQERLQFHLLKIIKMHQKKLNNISRVHNINDEPVFSDSYKVLDQLFSQIERLWHVNKRPIVVALAAPATWGKSTFACAVISMLGNRNVMPADGVSISTDDFGLSPWEMAEKGLTFTPESIRIGELIWTIRELIRGKTVVVPKFVHTKPTRRFALAQTNSLIVLEGLFALWQDGSGVDGGTYEELNKLIDLKLVVCTDVEQSLQLSVESDLSRGFTSGKVIERYLQRRSQYYEYVNSCKGTADCLLKTGKFSLFRSLRQLNWLKQVN